MRTNQPLLLITLLAFMMTAFNTGNRTATEKQVTIEINFGNENVKTVAIPWEANLTALEALQKAARVTTHPAGEHVFVIGIDQVMSEKHTTAWYYHVNSKPADKLAIEKMVKPGDIISWFYKKDVCSKK